MAEDRGAPEPGSVFGAGGILLLLALLTAAAAAGSAFALARFSASVLVLMAALRGWTRIGSGRLSVSFGPGEIRLFPGESFGLSAEIANRSVLPLRLRLEFPRVPGIESPGPSGPAVEAGFLPFERRRGSWIFTAVRRGVFRLGPVRLVSGDPLGLFTRERELPLDRDIVVFPRILPLALPDLPFREYFGIRAARGIVEDPAWYEGTREYSGIRPAKNIHWKASARLASLQEKIFEPTSHRKAFLLVEGEGFERAGDAEGFEKALELAGSLASLLSEEGASFALAVDREVAGYPAVLGLGRGPEHLGAVLELLARCSIGPGRGFPALLSGPSPGNAGWIVLSREPGRSAAAALGRTAGRRNPVLHLCAVDGSDGPGESAAASPRVPASDPGVPAETVLRFRDLLPSEGDGE